LGSADLDGDRYAADQDELGTARAGLHVGAERM
jgi:hypothetical protein